VLECDCEASITRRPWPTGGCCAIEGGGEFQVLLIATFICTGKGQRRGAAFVDCGRSCFDSSAPLLEAGGLR
jgi:hypothetical protein